MLRIISIIASVLLIATCSIAAVDSLKGTTVNVDNNLLCIDGGTSLYLHFNLGGRIYSQNGWISGGTSKGTSLIDSSYGKTISGWNITSIDDNDDVDSAFVYFYNDQAIGNVPEVQCYGVPSNWREGSHTTGAHVDSMSTTKSRGYGTCFNGATVNITDSAWSAAEQLGTRWLSTTNVTAQNTWYRWDVTAMVADSHAAGINYVSFLFYDSSYVGGSGHERWTMILSEAEASFPTLVPYFVIYHTPHVEPDPRFVKITVTPPSAPLTDYPVRVSIQTYGQPLNLDELTFLASDMTTKLYWCPDSLNTAGTKLWAYVINDWTSSPENIYVTQVENTSYQNCDSVFIIHENFNTSYSVSSPVTDWDSWNCTVTDTAGISFVGNMAGPDSILREWEAPIHDWQESSSSLRYKWFYAGDMSYAGSGASTRYNDTFTLWASSSTLSGPYTRQDTIMYDSVGTPKPLHGEDPAIKYITTLGKWIMICENHNKSDEYHVGLFYADSLDQPTWGFRGNIPLLEPSALGGPANWLAKEQASPALCLVGDTLYLTFEAFDGAGTSLSFTGLAKSYSNGGSDTLGLDWHLCDSTGAINDANPSPIIRYRITGARDSSASIPDALHYMNGEWGLVHHGDGADLVYTSSTLSSATLDLNSFNAAQIAEAWRYDSTNGNFVGMFPLAHDSVVFMRARTYDTTAFRSAQNDFDVLTRGGLVGGHNRFRGGEAYTSGGQLLMYPPQWITGCMALMSRDSFPTGVKADIWMASTSAGDGTNYINVAFGVASGGDSLQDYYGRGWNNPVSNGVEWGRAAPIRGNSFYINPTAARIYQDVVADTFNAVVSAFTLDANSDTLRAMHKHSFYLTSQDSLKHEIDGVPRMKGKDPTYTASQKRLYIIQGEALYNNQGGVVRIDSIRVSKFTTAEASAVTSDSLMLSVLSEDSNWNIFNCWLRAWRSW